MGFWIDLAVVSRARKKKKPATRIVINNATPKLAGRSRLRA
ncbi:hypothetical protein N8967_03715 [Akkermansiaceae bacterium]|nr:hypothetical protein [Akkermansiaceae bacterium]